MTAIGQYRAIDAIGMIDVELAAQRKANAIGFDRAEALVELRGLAIEAANASNRVTVDFGGIARYCEQSGEQARAGFDALTRRIAPEEA